MRDHHYYFNRGKVACLPCRKSWSYHHLSIHFSRPEICPQCSRALVNIGLDFKAPRTNDIKQWRKVEKLLQAGYSFRPANFVDMTGPGPRPRLLGEVEEFITEDAARRSEATRLKRSKEKAELVYQRRRRNALKLEAIRRAQMERKKQKS